MFLCFFLWLEEKENTDNTCYFSPDLIPSGEKKKGKKKRAWFQKSLHQKK